MNKWLAIILTVLIAHVALIAETVLAESDNSINLGVGGVFQLIPHCRANIFLAEYEHLLDSKIAVLARASGDDYRFDDGNYRETGRPRGADVGVRFYPGGNGMKGFFVGGALGYWTTDWSFNDNKGTSSETQGKGDSKSLRADIDVGARIPVGYSSISIMPALHVGKFFSSTSCEYTAPGSVAGSSCSKNGEVGGYYGFLAVSVGIGF
jgi:hypothetical protein